MAESRNRTARSFLRTGDGPTAAAPADTESFVLPPRSSATHRESLRNSALSSTLVPVSSPALLPPPSVPASPVPSAIARSGCSSPTSVGHALIRCQRALLHHRRALPQVNQDLAFCSSRSQRDPLMMRRKRQRSARGPCGYPPPPQFPAPTLPDRHTARAPNTGCLASPHTRLAPL